MDEMKMYVCVFVGGGGWGGGESKGMMLTNLCCIDEIQTFLSRKQVINHKCIQMCR